ncbi:acid phosphatase [Stenotrophomonas chelatiphaga]|uniref:acid phosphatase n=1 Tax=Stenotrophomonas chelatiphaga TaxID=517011 RepID=UPI002898BCA5|nr:phosphatase PAP2 family protein [Stenotrophomonas chelatiphaga]
MTHPGTAVIARISPFFLATLSLIAATSPVAAKVTGYLEQTQVPDSIALVPAPPAAGTVSAALDVQVSREALALRGTERFAQASLDADDSFPKGPLPPGGNQFSCALGMDVDSSRTPAIFSLLQRSRRDASATAGPAKNQHLRQRPYVVNAAPTCTPEEEDKKRETGSYPSGHGIAGWAWALILAEVAPERADAIFARGRNYAESRLVCNMHWHSDIVQARFLGAALVARLHDNPEFQADLLAAEREIAAARATGRSSSRDCAAEEAVLQVRPQSAL